MSFYSENKWFRYSVISLYSLASMGIFFLVGLFSKRRRVLRSKWTLSLIFGTNLIFPQFVLAMPFVGTTLLNMAGMCSMYLGLRFKVIGLTGGIASGKSTVSRLLSENGYKIIDADAISHQMRKFDTHYQRLLVAEFGEQVFDPIKKEINSAVLGEIVFNSAEKRRRLGSLTNWRIFREMVKQIFKYRVMDGERYVVLDAPTLFETKVLEYFCCPIVVVYIEDEELQLKRLMMRNPDLSEDQAKKRIGAQYPVATKLARSDVHIENSYKVEDLERQILQKSMKEIE